MNPIIRNDVTVTPAYVHPSSETMDMKVAYTSPQPTVPAMSRTLATMKEMGVDPSKVEVDESLKTYSLSLTAEDYVQQYKNIADYSSLTSLREKANAAEHMLRQMYAKKAALQENPLMKEKYPLLVPAFGNDDIFSCRALFPEEKNIPKVFPLGDKRKNAGVSSIVTQEGFNTNWRIFSERILDLVDWNNVFIAGGSVLACILPPPPKATKNFKCLRKYFHEDVYAGSDIDLYIYGLNEEEGKKKLEDIYEAVCNEIPYPVIAFRSAYAISIVSQFPYRHIQIILRLYSSPAEILMGFDVDACSIGFDGSQVYMTPRCHQALVRQMNTVDMTRRSPTYEMRLAKYADRGFEVEVPSLMRERIDPMIFEKPWDDVRGLAKLLLLEKLRTPEARYAYKERSTGSRSGASWKMQRMMQDPYLKKRLEYSNEKASDYSTVFLPWGPQWNAKKIRKLMMTKDIMLNSSWSEMYSNRGYHTHPCFVGTLLDVEKDCCGCCPEIPKDVDPETLECFVRGPLSFIVDDPGRQTIGSFHPITDGDWSDGAYLNKDSEKLSIAANSGDIATIREMIQGGLPVNTPDSLGRTALHIAVLTNQVETVKVLLDLGADPLLHLKDGRNIVHIAAEYGYLEMLGLLLDRLRLSKKNTTEGEESSDSLDLDEVNPSTQLTALHYAILFGHVDCVEFLLENGAMCDKMIWSTDKQYAVSVYVLAAHTECFNPQVAIDLYKILHSHGASLKLLGTQYNNVMHMLCSFNYIHFMQYLLENDPVAVSLCSELNNNCTTPLGIAVEKGYYTMARMMIDHGVSFVVTESAINALNVKRKRDKSQSYYGFRQYSAEDIRPLTMQAVDANTEASFEFLSYLIEKGADVNQVTNNQTLLDHVLSKNFYLTEEEQDQTASPVMTNYLDNLLKKQEEGSYAYEVIKEYRDKQVTPRRKQKKTMWSKKQQEESREAAKKLYELLDSHGAMTWREMFEIEGPEAMLQKTKKTGSSKHRTSTFAMARMYEPTTECVTVKNGKVLRGEKRLKALRDEYLKSKDQRNRMDMTNSNVTNIPGYSMFTMFNAKTNGWRSNSQIVGEEAQKYVELFNAVKKGDCDKVRKLCTPDKDGSCCHVLVTGYHSLSPLALAINQADHPMIALLFELMEKQYTPITVNRTVVSNTRISNYALVTGDEEEEDVFVDPNSDASNIINTCDVGVAFTEQGTFDMTGCPAYRSCSSSQSSHCIGSSSWGFGMGAMTMGGYDNESTEDRKEETCTIFEYLVYRGDSSLLRECFDHLKKLSDAVMKKDEAANCVKKDDIFEKTIMTSLFDMTIGGYNRNTSNILIAAIINDNLDILRCVIQYTMGGLNVLREKDLLPVEKSKKVNSYHYEDYSDEEYSDWDSDCSCDSECSMDCDCDCDCDDNANENVMDVEDREENEPDTEASEYADSDEEDMKAMQQFREGGKTTDDRRRNTYFPVLVAIRYKSVKAFRYFLDSKRVIEDLEMLKSLNPLLYSRIEEADGSEKVWERVFSLKPITKMSRLMLEAAAVDDNVEMFQQLANELQAEKFDLSVLIHASKRYPSLLEYAVNNRYLQVAAYLMQHFSFHHKEIISAYNLLSSAMNTSVFSCYSTSTTWCSSSSKKKDDPVKTYQRIICLIDLIPQDIKKKVVEVFLKGILKPSRPAVLREVLDHIPGGITELEEYDEVVKQVIESSNENAMQVLIECLGLRMHLMDEDTYGYTVVERVMNKYMSDVTANKEVRVQPSEGAAQKERMDEEAMNEEAKEGEKEAAVVELKRKMKTSNGSISNILEMVLKNANGLPRCLTNHEAVQKRVKKDSEEASKGNFGRRLCLGTKTKSSEYQYKSNGAMNMLGQLHQANEHNSCVCYKQC